VLTYAFEEATRLGHDAVHPEHLLLALVVQTPTAVSAFVEPRPPERLRDRLAARRLPDVPRLEDRMELSAAAIEALAAAVDEAAALEQDVRPEHLLLGVLRTAEDVAVRSLFDLDALAERIRSALRSG
jgi:ATP-dependent Clp protease ATP-binding subunit ClpA